MRYRRHNWSIIGGLLTLLLIGGCGKSADRYIYRQIVMGVEARITVYASDETVARSATTAAFDRMNELDAVLSDYRPDSELMRLCDTHDRWVPVSDDLFHVLGESRRISERSNGAFDITIGPVVQLWRLARTTGELPRAESLQSAHKRVGWRLVELDRETQSARLRAPNMRLDVGGIGKGYAIDVALETLSTYGIRSALVDLGGDVAASDPPPGESGWRVATQTTPPVVFLTNRAIATSGATVQFVEIDGVRCSHIVDPRTGIGVTHHMTVAVVADDCTTADALASALSVLGPIDGAALLREFDGAQMFVQ